MAKGEKASAQQVAAADRPLESLIEVSFAFEGVFFSLIRRHSRAAAELRVVMLPDSREITMPNEEAEYRLVHNPGYDFMRLVLWMDEASRDGGELTIAPYFVPVLALIGACTAIEGYVDMLGRMKDRNWETFIKENLRFKDRLKRVYSHSPVKLDLGSGIWQRVILMFRQRNELVHLTYIDTTETREDEIPTVFQELARKFPASESREISEEAISTLATDFSMPDLRKKWQLRYYSGPAR